jgi:peptide/nickel transport system substrate-binding protein
MAAALGAVGVVGCSSSNNKNSTKTAPTAASSASATATRTAAGSPAAGSPAAGAGGGTSAAALTPLPAAPAGLKRGGRIQWPVGDPGGNLDPYRDAGTGLFTIQAVYNGLVRARIPPGKGVVIYPDLADSYERPDGSSIVFHLHPGVTWQNVPPTNGRAFTSADVKAALQRMATNQPGFTLQPFLTFISGIETPDPNTVKLNFSQPYGPLLNMLGDTWHVMVPPELYNGDDAKGKSVGTGPFVVTKYEPGVIIAMDANKSYFKQGQPYVAGIDFPLNLDATTGQAAFYSKKSDITSILFALQGDYQSKVSDATFQKVAFSPFEIEMNNARAPFNDLRVRQAMLYAADPSLISTVGFQGNTRPGQPFGSLLSQYQLPQSELPKRDVQKAKQLLAAAGQSNLTVENWLYGPPDNGPDQIRQSVADAGITMKFKITDFPTWRVGAYTNGDMDLTSTNVFVYPNPDQQLWIKYHTGGGNNNTHFSDPTFDKMLEDARAELDANKSVALYQNAARYLLQQVPSTWPVETLSLFALQARLKNLTIDEGANADFLEYKAADEIYLDPPS